MDQADLLGTVNAMALAMLREDRDALKAIRDVIGINDGQMAEGALKLFVAQVELLAELEHVDPEVYLQEAALEFAKYRT